MPEFIVVQCVQCEQVQVVQKRAPQGKLKVVKFDCGLCRKKQSVTAILGAAGQAGPLRPLAQRLNEERGKRIVAKENGVGPPVVEETRVAVRVAYDPVWDELLPDESSSSESGEALPTVRGSAPSARKRTARPKKQRKSDEVGVENVQKKKREEEEEEDIVFKKPHVARQQQQQQDDNNNDDDQEENVFVRRDDHLTVVRDEEVWQDPEE